MCAGRRPRCESVRLPARVCRRRRAAGKCGGEGKTFSPELVNGCRALPPAPQRRAPDERGLLGSSRRLQHLMASVSVRVRVC